MLTEILLLPDVSYSHPGTLVPHNSGRIRVDKVAQPQRKVHRSCRQWTQRTGDQEHRHRAPCLRLRPDLVGFPCIVFVLISKSAGVTYARSSADAKQSALRRVTLPAFCQHYWRGVVDQLQMAYRSMTARLLVRLYL